MTSRLVGRLALVATIVIFCAAIIVLFREFASVSPHDVLARLAALPKRQIFAAIGLTALSYLLLTGYDFLALRYVRRRLRFRDVLFASFTAFAFSNNIGFQLLSGGSMRYRIYSGFGLDAVEIGEIVAFCTFTYALGIITVGGLLALFDPADISSLLHFPQSLTSAFGIALLALSTAFLVFAGVWRKPIALGRYRLRPPSLTLALSQVALASIDAALAGTMMYVLLPVDLGHLPILSRRLFHGCDGIGLKSRARGPRRVRDHRHLDDGNSVEGRVARRVPHLSHDLFHRSVCNRDRVLRGH